MKRGTHHYVRLNVIYEMFAIRQLRDVHPGSNSPYVTGGVATLRRKGQLFVEHPWLKEHVVKQSVPMHEGNNGGTDRWVLRDKMAFLKAAKESGKFHPKQVSDLEQQIVQQVILEAH